MMKPMSKADLEEWAKAPGHLRDKEERKALADLVGHGLAKVERDPLSHRGRVTLSAKARSMLKEAGLLGRIRYEFHF